MNKTKTTTAVVTALAAVALAYYAYAPRHENAAPQGGASRPVAVTSVLAQQRDYPVRLTANGVVTALNTVDIRAQVTSTVARVHIREGQFVRAGELLFTLDSRADEVVLAKAQAQLERDLAALADLQRQLARSQDLFARKFVAQSVLDSSATQVQAQQALVSSDRAAVRAAQVALSYDRIVAPAAGRTGLINVYPGSLVQPNATAAALVTITQIDPVAVSFALPQRDLAAALDSMRRSDSFVLARLPDSGQVFKGKLQFVDNQVDAASGTVRVKAVFDNKEMKLWPGAFVNVEFSAQTLHDAVVLPHAALVTGPRGQSVYVVEAGKARQQPVQVVHSFGADAVVSGIAAGTKVVLDGKQNLRPGSAVKERDAAAAGAP